MSEAVDPSEVTIKGRARRDRDEAIILLALLTMADVYEAETYWQRNAPTAYKGMLDGKGWQYTPATMQWSAVSPVSSIKIKSAIIAVATQAEAQAKAMAGQLTSGNLDLADWQQQMGQLIKNVNISTAAVARGGLGKTLTPDGDTVPGVDIKELGLSADVMIIQPESVSTTGDAVLYQFKRLDQFARQIEARAPGLETIERIADRAALYPRSAITFFEQVRNREAMAVGVTEELNVLGESEHCFSPKGDPIPDCPSQTAYGWAPVGTLTPIGLRKCRMNCRCTMSYRRGSEELQ